MLPFPPGRRGPGNQRTCVVARLYSLSIPLEHLWTRAGGALSGGISNVGPVFVVGLTWNSVRILCPSHLTPTYDVVHIPYRSQYHIVHNIPSLTCHIHHIPYPSRTVPFAAFTNTTVHPISFNASFAYCIVNNPVLSSTILVEVHTCHIPVSSISRQYLSPKRPVPESKVQTTPDTDLPR